MLINVMQFLGKEFNIEDAIVLRRYIKDNINNDVELDFKGIEKVPSTFLVCLFNNLMNELGRDYVFSQIKVKNLTNYNDYLRVVKGTTFLEKME